MYAGTGPYKSLKDLPKPVTTLLSPAGQQVYLETFNAVLSDCWGDTQMAGRKAWDVAKHADGVPTREVLRRQERAAKGLPVRIPSKSDR